MLETTTSSTVLCGSFARRAVHTQELDIDLSKIRIVLGQQLQNFGILLDAAPSDDGITAEFRKAGGIHVLAEIMKMFQPLVTLKKNGKRYRKPYTQ